MFEDNQENPDHAHYDEQTEKPEGIHENEGDFFEANGPKESKKSSRKSRVSIAQDEDFNHLLSLPVITTNENLEIQKREQKEL